jgi:hypothetical protein
LPTWRCFLFDWTDLHCMRFHFYSILLIKNPFFHLAAFSNAD